MTTDDTTTHWLGRLAETPAGRAWDAVTAADHITLEQLIAEHGQETTRLVPSTLGHPVSAIAAAARNGDSLATKMLIAAAPDREHLSTPACGHMTQSPAAWAVEARSLACLRLLLNAGALPAEGEALCDIAVTRGADPVMQPEHPMLGILTMRASADELAMALNRAVERGAAQWVQQLLDGGACPNTGCNRTHTKPLEKALDLTGGARMLSTLLEGGADATKPMQMPNGYRRPTLIAAVERGASWAIQPLVEAGADPNTAVEWLAANTPVMHPPSGTAETLALLVKTSLQGRRAATTKAATTKPGAHLPRG